MNALRSGRTPRRWLASLAAVPASAVHAATGAAEPSVMFDQAYLVQVLGALILVSACLYGLVFLLKKLNGVPVNSRRLLRVVSSVKVGTREKIMLIETGENQLLVGVAAGGISTLHVFGSAVGESGESTGTGREFSDLLPSSALPEARR